MLPETQRFNRSLSSRLISYTVVYLKSGRLETLIVRNESRPSCARVKTLNADDVRKGRVHLHKKALIEFQQGFHVNN